MQTEDVKLIWQTRDEMDAPTNPLQALMEGFTRQSRDMGADIFTAWAYGIIVGWDDASYEELAEQHSWTPAQVKYQKEMHQAYKKAWNLYHKSLQPQ